MDNKMIDRAKMVVCMEYVCRQISDEDVFVPWLMTGVADGDIEYGNLNPDDVEDYYIENDENFEELMSSFLRRMNKAYESGGLYCGGITCKDKSDY